MFINKTAKHEAGLQLFWTLLGWRLQTCGGTESNMAATDSTAAVYKNLVKQFLSNATFQT